MACGGDTLPPSNTGGANHSTGGSTGQAAAGGRLGTGGVALTTGGVFTTGGMFVVTGGNSGMAGSLATGGAFTTGGVLSTGGSVSSGGAAGGQGGTNAGSAGRDPGAGGEDSAGAGGEVGNSICNQTRSSRAARSAGFSGSYKGDYYPLYSASCVTPEDCAAACVAAGGTQTSCAASDCIDSTPDYCLPPTYWFDFDKLLVEGNTEESSTWIIMVNNPYRDQLLVSDFQFEIPASAAILGIRFAFNEAADSPNAIADQSVKALQNGTVVGLDRGRTTAWPSAFQYVEYGSSTDLWGATWSPELVNSSQFGVALTPMYLESGGNARAYVDFVKATVYYSCN